MTRGGVALAELRWAALRPANFRRYRIVKRLRELKRKTITHYTSTENLGNARI